jgi:aryl-phospho-beta-D-glucosidase BglC (GH1 family)
MGLAIRCTVLAVMALGWSSLASAQEAATQPASRPTTRAWWNQGFPGGRRGPLPGGRTMPLISVKGNKFVDPDGKVVLFRGVSISDPDKIAGQGHWNQEHFQHVKELGVNVVRIPVHPAAWRERTPTEYLKILDQAVRWCTDLEMYVIIDWHSIGNLKMELFQDPMYDTTQKETFEFWRTIARRYNGNNTVAFYEIFNEPTTYRGQLGTCSWSEWKKLNEDIIALMRSYDTETIPLVAGFDWAYDLTPLIVEPIAAEGVGYVTHPYSNKRSKPWEPKWEENFGFAAEKYPIIATEFGFGAADASKIREDHYANRITKYCESKGIGWVAWCFDPQWGPTMLKNWDYELTGMGEYIKLAAQRPPATQPVP